MSALVKRYSQMNGHGGRIERKADRPGRKPACVPPAAAWSLSTSPLLVSRIWASSVRGITSLSLFFPNCSVFDRSFFKKLYQETEMELGLKVEPLRLGQRYIYTLSLHIFPLIT
jgi:hypothetical protein